MAVDLSFEEIFNFDGYLTVGDNEFHVKNIKIIRKKYLYLDDITFKVNFSKNDRVSIVDLTGDNGGTFLLKGSLLNKSEVVANAYWMNLNENELSGIITELKISNEILESVPRRQFLHANLSDTCLALPEVDYLAYHYTGEIKTFLDKKSKKNDSSFSTGIGRATLVKHYSFEDDETDDTDVLIRVSRVTVNIDLEEQYRSCDQNILLEKFKNELEPIEYILSFLSRRQVRWHELILISEDTNVWETRELRKGFSTTKPDNTLVNPHCLSDSGSLDEVVKLYIGSPYQESIKHSVNYLNARWKDSSIETMASNSFTAFETIVNGICEHHGNQEIIEGIHFKKLRGKIEKVIKEYCVDNGFGGGIRSDLYKKVNELKRAPIVSRAIKIIEENNIYISDLIKNDESLELFLRDAYRERSVFLHTGKIENFSDFLFKADRIHALTERLIYKLVGGKKDWLDTFAYRYAFRRL